MLRFLLLFPVFFLLLHSPGLLAQSYTIECNDEGCKGSYSGPEFVGRDDVAHQFSNHMSNRVGDELKALYDQGKYRKVDLSNIQMTTQNMDHKGNVVYSLHLPFVAVSKACEAATAFDHRGGWGHQITRASVLHTFRKKVDVEVVELNTPEGLQEFWVQWKHESRQSHCK